MPSRTTQASPRLSLRPLRLPKSRRPHRHAFFSISASLFTLFTATTASLGLARFSRGGRLATAAGELLRSGARARRKSPPSSVDLVPELGFVHDWRFPSLVAMDSSSSCAGASCHPRVWSDPHEALARCVPTLTPASHKGSSGRIGVLGGSPLYTGAPYYAAMSALKTGADLAFVFCASEAAVPIKCYSPELMVQGVYSGEEFDKCLKKGNGDGVEGRKLVLDMVTAVTSKLDQMHALIVGPGLGRCPLVMRATAHIIRAARDKKLPLVIDADGLFLLTHEEYKDLVAGYRGVVLTPNKVEYGRLVDAMSNSDSLFCEEGPFKDGFEKNTEGVVVVQKGHHDLISTVVTTVVSAAGGVETVARGDMVCEEKGGLKRSGGIGDVLSGTLGTFVAWNRILSRGREAEGSNDEQHRGVDDDLLLACWSACCAAKRATRKAFVRKRRAMTAPDVLEELGLVLDEMTSSSIEEG